MEATTILFSTLTSRRFSLNSSSSSLPIHKTLSSSNSTNSTTISPSWAASTLSVAFSSRNSFTRELWGLLNSKAEMFGHLTNSLESSWNKLKGEAFPNNSPLSLSSFAMPKSGSTRLPRASSRNTILHCGRFELRYTKFRQQRANIQKSQFLTTAPSKKKKTPPDDHSIHSYSSENSLPLPDPDIGLMIFHVLIHPDHMEEGPNGQKICNENVEWNTIWSGSMKMKADMDESSPNATMLATQDVAYQCNVLGLSPLNFYMLNYIMFQAPGYMREQN